MNHQQQDNDQPAGDTVGLPGTSHQDPRDLPDNDSRFVESVGPAAGKSTGSSSLGMETQRSSDGNISDLVYELMIFQMDLLGKDSVFNLLGTRGYLVISQYFAHLSYFGIFFRLSWLGLFGFFLAITFQNMYYYQKFVSMTPTSGKCSDVPRPWTISDLRADFNGNWASDIKFNPNKATYSFYLSNFKVIGNQYAEFMTSIQKEIDAIGEKTQGFDLTLNLVYWSSWYHTEITHLDPNDSLSPLVSQFVTTTADATYIILADRQQGTIASVKSDCVFAASTEFFDRQLGILTMQIDMSKINNFPSCQSLINAPLLGYDPLVSGDIFTIEVDVHSLFTALSVAHKVNGRNTLDRLTKIDFVVEALFDDGKVYQVERYYDPVYATMLPIYCLGPKGDVKGDTWNCVLQIGSAFGIPFLHHSGSSTSSPEPCDCKDASGSGRSEKCNQIDLLSGLIVYDISQNSSAIKKYDKLFQPFLPIIEFFYVCCPLNTGSSAVSGVFPAAWSAIYGQGSPLFKNSTWRTKAYNFAKSRSFSDASIVVFSSFTAIDQTITRDKYQLKHGSCANSFSSPNFGNLTSKAWGPLSESYYQCTMLFRDALSSSAGIASGTTSIIVPLVMICLMYAVYLYYLLLEMYDANRVKPQSSINSASSSSAAKVVPLPHNLNSPGKESTVVSTGDDSFGQRLHTLEQQYVNLLAFLNKNEHLFGWRQPFKMNEDVPKQTVSSISTISNKQRRKFFSIVYK